MEIGPNLRQDVDQTLIRQGAVIYLLSDLNDMMRDCDADYLEQPCTQKIRRALETEPAIAAVKNLAG